MSPTSEVELNSDPCKVAIVGLGTVGGGVAEVLWQHGQEDCNSVKLAGILENSQENPNLSIWAHRDQNLLYSSLEELLADPSIDVVVETVGGQTYAREMIARILESGRDVVTANKDLMAVHGQELLNLAEKNGRQLLFEASVTGAIPVVRLLQDYFHVEDIQQISGIFNGTSNYILTEMEQQQLSFEMALRQAQDLGFAEADPLNDIAGYDARYKLVILTYLITGIWLAPEEIKLEGIEHLEPVDFAYASRMDRRIKLIGYLKRQEQNLQAFVLPLMVPCGGTVAEIGGSTNIVSIEGKFSEEITLVGKGAGSLPTASALVADLEKISRGIVTKNDRSTKQYRLQPFDEYVFRHTLRITVKDRPGIVGQIGQILAKHEINIYALEQLPQYHQKDASHLVIFTLTLEACQEALLIKALEKIKKEVYWLQQISILREIA
jgi:homoserine dehydrogenase